MRFALFAFIVLTCGCIPSPTKPLGVSETTPAESTATAAVTPSADGVAPVETPTEVAESTEPQPEPFSLAPSTQSTTNPRSEMVELNPDVEPLSPALPSDAAAIDSTPLPSTNIGAAEGEAPAIQNQPFSFATRPADGSTLTQAEVETNSRSIGDNIKSNGPSDMTITLPTNPASIAELAESAASEIVERAGQAVDSVVGSLLPATPATPRAGGEAGLPLTSKNEQEFANIESLPQIPLQPSDSSLEQQDAGRFSLGPENSNGMTDEPKSDSSSHLSAEDQAGRFDDPTPSMDLRTDATAQRSVEQRASLPNLTEPIRLIPREVLFGAPQRARPRLSPDGRRLAFLAPKNGVLNIWVAPIDQIDRAVPLTNQSQRGIRNFFWAYTNEHLVFSHDEAADQKYHVYSIDVRDGAVRDLTPLESVSARIESVSDRFPTEILMGINDRAPHDYHDLYRVNLLTGQRQLVLENPGFASLLADDDYQVRFALSYTPDGGQMIVQRDDDDPRGWNAYLQLDPEDAMTTGIVGFDKSGQRIYLRDSRNRNTTALRVVDLRTNQQATLAENRSADVGGVMIHPSDKHVEAVTFNFQRPEWQVVDKQLLPDFEYLDSVADGDLQIASRTLDDRAWIVAYTMDDGPIRYYHYQRNPRKATLLFTSNPELLRQPLVPMQPVVIKSRDGLDLVSYYSLPKDTDPTGSGRPTTPLPLVLDVHGGPWARDAWGFDPVHQLLANRGYAVLSVNFRGSTGFGKSFVNAADGEWAGRMHNDLIDAVEWAVQHGIADQNRIGIMGGSYGGYATLVGLSFTPNQFACGIDIGGPANLESLLQNPPAHWQPMMPLLSRHIATIETEQGQNFARSRSPLMFASRIASPLLIVDPATGNMQQRAESEQIVRQLNRQQVPVTHLAFPSGSLGLAAPANRLAFYAVAEAFLAQHLGGRSQPIDSLLQHADLQVPVGSEQIPGLRVASRNTDSGTLAPVPPAGSFQP